MNAHLPRAQARYLARLCDVLAADGVDVDALLHRAGLPAGRFDDGQPGVPAGEIEAFVTAYRRLTGRTDLGVRQGQLIKMNAHELMGYGMISCRCLDEMLRFVSRHYHLMTETFHLRHLRTADGAETLYTPALAMPLEALRFHLEALAVAHQNQVQLIHGRVSYDIHLSMPPPPHMHLYREMSPVRFHFDERALPGVRVAMPRELLERPMPLHDPRTLRQVEDSLPRAPRRLPDAGGWGEFVRMLLREAGSAPLSLPQLARHVGVSARHVQRHLKDERLKYRDLVRQARIELACRLLQLPGVTVSQAAARTGFSDAASFGRAFKREAQRSPGQYRRLRGLPG